MMHSMSIYPSYQVPRSTPPAFRSLSAGNRGNEPLRVLTRQTPHMQIDTHGTTGHLLPYINLEEGLSAVSRPFPQSFHTSSNCRQDEILIALYQRASLCCFGYGGEPSEQGLRPCCQQAACHREEVSCSAFQEPTTAKTRIQVFEREY